MLPYTALLFLIPLKMASFIIALRGTVAGRLKPDRVTLVLVSLPSLITFCIAIVHGAAFSAIPVLVAGLAPLVVFCLTFFSHQKPWGVHPVDYISGILSLIAIIVWIFIHNPVAAVCVSILADFLAIIPTMIKAWYYPRTESLWMYVLASIGTGIGLATLKVWSIETAGFSLYLSCMGIIMILVLIHKKLARRFQRAI